MSRVGDSFFGITPRVFRWLSIALLLLGIISTCHGTSRMFVHSGDYRIRWAEEHYVYRGKNPGDVRARLDAEANHLPIPEPSNGRDSRIDIDLMAADGAYPLSSYFTATIVTWPSNYVVARLYYDVLNLIWVATLGYWFYELGEKQTAGLGLFFLASFLAMSSLSATLIVAQYGVPILVALYGMLLLAQRSWLWTGICFGVAMVKISIAAPFALPFMVKNRWAPLFVAGAYLLIGTALMWPLVQTNPLHVFQQTTSAAAKWQDGGYSLNNLFEYAGVNTLLAMKMAAVISLVLAMIILYFYRDSSLLTLFGIAAVASRAWCYHRQYDNLVLVFLLVALGVSAWRTQSRLVAGAYLLVGISLWVPASLADYSIWDALQWIAWLCGLAVLLHAESLTKPDLESRGLINIQNLASYG